jgi:predicted AAA+ superfamily ATPase
MIKDFQESTLPKMVDRDIVIDYEPKIQRAVSIIGPRRTGKTYLLFLAAEKVTTKYGKTRCFYINFEDDRLVGCGLSDLRTMLRTSYELYPDNIGKKIWFFLDEIQNVSGWETFVRSTIDSGKVQIFVSGSSAKLLSKEISTAMRGRTIPYTVMPFSFHEMLKAKGVETENLSTSGKAKLFSTLDDYLIYGGYPESIIYPEQREKIMKEIMDVTIYRDIIDRYKVKNTHLLKLFLKCLLSSSSLSVHKFHSFLKSQGISVSKNTLYNYLSYFSDSLVVFPLRKYSPSYKESEQTIPKIYFVDNGLLTSNGIDARTKLFENMVFAELLKSGLTSNESLWYYLSEKEVDFVITKGKKVVRLIQASYDVSNYDTKDREIGALVKASNEFDCNNLEVVTWDYEKQESYNGKKISFVPFWKFALERSRQKA